MNRLEIIARLLHQGLVDYGAGTTGTPGPPSSCSPWEALGLDEQGEYRFVAANVLRDWQRGALSLADLPASIHNAWAHCVAVEGKQDDHAVFYGQAHPKDPREHRAQASLIAQQLQAWERLRSGADDSHQCLMLLPLRTEFIEVYEQVIKFAIQEEGFRARRPDQLSGEEILSDVVDCVESATVIVADITEDNANVNFELGIAKALGRPVVMISRPRTTESVPFYHKSHRIHFYDPSQPGWQEQLSSYIRVSIARARRSDGLSENAKLGITAFYAGDGPEFQDALIRDIGRTKSCLVAVGWGLAFIGAQRREVLKAMRDQITKERALEAFLLMPRADHPGLQARVEEEQHAQREVARHVGWPVEFFEFLKELPVPLAAEDCERVHVRRLPYMPTAMVVRLDNVYFFRTYGPPNVGGWACPWIRFDAQVAGATWRSYLENHVTYATTHAYTEEA